VPTLVFTGRGAPQRGQTTVLSVDAVFVFSHFLDVSLELSAIFLKGLLIKFPWLVPFDNTAGK
jgi:hypothetical protein